MKTFLIVPQVQAEKLPADFDDVRFSEALVELMLGEFSQPGDIIFDPFAGYGTALVVAERMGRRPMGLELDPGRAAYARSRLSKPDCVIEGDARQLVTYQLPMFDLSFTSPPYMSRYDSEDPLAAYAIPGKGYEAYLRGLQDIYRQVGALMKPGARTILEVSNIKQIGLLTTLAWDVAAAIGEVLPFEGEIVIGCDSPEADNCGYNHSYCLVFRGNKE
jgi:DNA modification methylase